MIFHTFIVPSMRCVVTVAPVFTFKVSFRRQQIVDEMLKALRVGVKMIFSYEILNCDFVFTC